MGRGVVCLRGRLLGGKVATAAERGLVQLERWGTANNKQQQQHAEILRFGHLSIAFGYTGRVQAYQALNYGGVFVPPILRGTNAK